MEVILLDSYEEPKGHFKLMRLVEWSGGSLNSMRHLRPSDPLTPNAVILALGQEAASRCGVSRYPLQNTRGYVYPFSGGWVIPTIHPLTIERGGAKWSAAFINDFQKAHVLARSGMPPEFTAYTLDPSPMIALEWARDYLSDLARFPEMRCAFDIETPGKGDDDEENDSDAPDRTWNIHRIGFACRAFGALSIPWEPPYQAAIRAVCGSHGEKVVWNHGFDVPRIRRAGVEINGTIHDGMVAWHILHSDQPKRLAYVATFMCPWQPAWKHLSGARPAFYNATDADVELRCMEGIEAELRRVGLWDVYQKDVIELDPLLQHMHHMGMPVDPGVRERNARLLLGEITQLRAQMEEVIPSDARTIDHVYAATPKDTSGLHSRRGVRTVPTCSLCGCERPRKAHFTRYKKKTNPCAEGVPLLAEVEVEEYYRLKPFTPSAQQMKSYHRVLQRANPTVFDPKGNTRRVSFNEEQLKLLAMKYPKDPLYPLILTYREKEKIASTYIGWWED